MIETFSQPANISQKPITVNQDSDQKNSLRTKQNNMKKKIIRKNNKSKTKNTQIIEHSPIDQINSPNAMAPFGIFQSQTQKCQRLQHYLRKDIQNFYRLNITQQETQLLDNLLNYNLVQLIDVYHKDLTQIWKEKICSISEIKNYLQIIMLVRKNNSNYAIIQDDISKKYYLKLINQNNQILFYQINQFENDLLQKRQKFITILQQSQQKYNNKKSQKSSQISTTSAHKMSQISIQIAFLFKSLYDSTKSLKYYIQTLKKSIQHAMRTQIPLQLHPNAQNKYISYLLKKVAIDAIKDTPIDYLNYFKNNQLIQHNYGPAQGVISDQKQFQQFMKKKKNKKGRKGKYVLHTACLGCCSSFYQQYNPLYYCQQCYIRFHRSCYTGYPSRDQYIYLNPREQKDVICQSCYNKKINPNYKSKGNQCDFCGLKGLLSVSAGQFKKIHIFCMLFNGLWIAKNNKIQFKAKTDKIPNSDSLKCLYCNLGVGYLHFCINCQKYVHVSCAYFNGWKIDGEFNQNSQNVQLKLQCCNGVNKQDNQKRRKFVCNFKKQAYSF